MKSAFVVLQQVPELFPGEIEDVGPQFLVARPEAAQPEHRWFDAFFDTQLFYTSNALLSEKGNQDTSVMVFTLQAAINLPPMEVAGGILSPRVGYRHQWWRYSLDDTANQLNNFDHFTHTDPSPVSHINDRLDTALGFTYTRELLPSLFIQPYYRLQWSHYTENSDRNDMYNNLGLTVVYMFNEWASVRAFMNYENRNSTDDTAADYHKWDTGGGVTFSAKF
jgi:hypothetical protein